ncbi:MAG TPA: PQQ-dependent sugar dehydrogenase [Xanthomonadaceae bacterium]|nr:PQQ-dependent sugar dehydrogenase [Xanthomonadaceae bacterium]
MTDLRTWILVAVALGLLACTPEAPRSPDGTSEAPAPEAIESAAAADPGRRVNTEYAGIVLHQVAAGLEHPWAIAFLPDGGMLVTERPGRLKRIDDEGTTEVAGLPDDIVAINQGGLMDVVLHPAFAENAWVYLTYSKGTPEATATTLIRGRLEGDALLDVEELFTQDRMSDPGRHYGSRLAFMPDGTLLMSIGDRGVDPPRAQDLGDHAGSLLRLNDDGSVPADNPFVGRDDVLPEIYSYGHRNIQGLIVHPETGAIWATEHGPRGGDELNLVKPGQNYGWPVVSRGRNYRTEDTYFEDTQRSKEGMVDPVIDWTPSLAASGLAYVDGERFPRWKGNLLAGGLRAEQVRRVVFDGDEVVHEEELIRGMVGRVRDVRIGPGGDIYVLTDQRDGGVYRIEPAG